MNQEMKANLNKIVVCITDSITYTRVPLKI